MIVGPQDLEADLQTTGLQVQTQVVKTRLDQLFAVLGATPGQQTLSGGRVVGATLSSLKTDQMTSQGWADGNTNEAATLLAGQEPAQTHAQNSGDDPRNFFPSPSAITSMTSAQVGALVDRMIEDTTSGKSYKTYSKTRVDQLVARLVTAINAYTDGQTTLCARGAPTRPVPGNPGLPITPVSDIRIGSSEFELSLNMETNNSAIQIDILKTLDPSITDAQRDRKIIVLDVRKKPVRVGYWARWVWAMVTSRISSQLIDQMAQVGILPANGTGGRDSMGWAYWDVAGNNVTGHLWWTPSQAFKARGARVPAEKDAATPLLCDVDWLKFRRLYQTAGNNTDPNSDDQFVATNWDITGMYKLLSNVRYSINDWTPGFDDPLVDPPLRGGETLNGHGTDGLWYKTWPVADLLPAGVTIASGPVHNDMHYWNNTGFSKDNNTINDHVVAAVGSYAALTSAQVDNMPAAAQTTPEYGWNPATKTWIHKSPAGHFAQASGATYLPGGRVSLSLDVRIGNWGWSNPDATKGQMGGYAKPFVMQNGPFQVLYCINPNYGIPAASQPQFTPNSVLDYIFGRRATLPTITVPPTFVTK